MTRLLTLPLVLAFWCLALPPLLLLSALHRLTRRRRPAEPDHRTPRGTHRVLYLRGVCPWTGAATGEEAMVLLIGGQAPLRVELTRRGAMLSAN